MNIPKYSVIIPVYNRPQELQELLVSLTLQSFKNFEVIVVEDGSAERCEAIVDQYRDKLRIQYFYKPNSGPGPSRNEGFKLASGRFVVFFDSDCILPPFYFQAVEKGLDELKLEVWGGPDKPHEDFTLLQRAMGYTMSSVLTTGGIRGGKKRVGWFQPRSFNMGMSRVAFEKTGGFKFDRYAEDIEFSIRMKKAGFRIGLIPDAYVYHKRRVNFPQFFRQVFNFGRGRALVGKVYPQEVKLAHWFPSFFTLASVATICFLPLNATLFAAACLGLVMYLSAIFIHSWMVNKNFAVALLSIPSALFQFYGYGLGFLKERLWSRLR